MLWLQRCLNKPLCPFTVCVQKMTHDLHVAPVVRLVSAKRPATEDQSPCPFLASRGALAQAVVIVAAAPRNISLFRPLTVVLAAEQRISFSFFRVLWEIPIVRENTRTHNLWFIYAFHSN